MYEPTHVILDKLRWLILGVVVLLVILLVCSFVLPATTTNTTTASDSPVNDAMSMYDGSNVVTNGVAMAVDEFTATMASAVQALDNGSRSAGTSVATATTRSGEFIAQSLRNSALFVGRGISSTIAFIGRSVSSSVIFAGRCGKNSAVFVGHSLIGSVTLIGRGFSNSATFVGRAVSRSVACLVHIPGTVLNFATGTARVSAFIKPAENTPIPKINPVAYAVAATTAAPAAVPVPKTAVQTASSADSTAVWPIHGAVTTLFGVPHWPYQPTHTGIDISDGRPAGVTPIRPFKPGRVIDVIQSSVGFGNHVIIDHGNGVTSLYGHMASTSVQIGQAVDKSTVLGFEGSTGASTGTHLHFEVRVNGQPTDPHQFVSGQP